MDLESPCSNEKLFQKLSSLQRESRILSRLSPTKDSVHYANSPGDLEDILCDVGEDDVYTMVLVFRIRDDPVLDRMEFYLENPEENQIESTLQVEKEWFENRKIKRQALRNAKEFFYFADSDDKTDKVKFVVHTTCKDDMAEGGVYVQLFDPLTGLVDTNMKFVDKQENPTISDVTCETLTVKFEHPVNDKGLETSYDLIIGEANGSKILARKTSKSTECTFTDLTPDTEYRVRIRTVFVFGYGRWSDWEHARTEKSLPCHNVFYFDSSMKQDAPGTLKYGNQPCGETDSMGWITIKRTGCHFVTINLTGDVSDSKLNLSFKHSRFNLTRQITENQHTSSREDGLFDSSVISASFLGLFTKGDKLCVQLNEGTTSAFDGNTSIAFMGHMVESEENAVAFYAERNTPLLIQTIVTYNFETGNIKDGCFVAPRNGYYYFIFNCFKSSNLPEICFAFLQNDKVIRRIIRKESTFSTHKECDEAYESSHQIVWLETGETLCIAIEKGGLQPQGTQVIPACFMGFHLQDSNDSVVFCSQSRKVIQEGGVITYENNVINHNGGVDLATGIFTAPTAGFYFFTFEFFKDRFVQKVKLHFLHNRKRVRTVVHCNFTQSEWGRHDEDNCSNNYIGRFEKGDTFCIELEKGLLSSGAELHFSATLMGYLINSSTYAVKIS